MHFYPERLRSREGRPQSCGMFHCTSGHAMTSRWVLVCTETTIDLPQCGQTASSAAALTEKRSCVTRGGLPVRNILLRNLITAGRGDVATHWAHGCAHCTVSGWRVLYHHNINLNDKTQWLRDKHMSGLSHSRILQVNLMHENTLGQYFAVFCYIFVTLPCCFQVFHFSSRTPTKQPHTINHQKALRRQHI